MIAQHFRDSQAEHLRMLLKKLGADMPIFIGSMLTLSDCMLDTSVSAL